MHEAAFPDDGVIVREVGRLCVTVWRKKVTPARFARQAAGVASIVRRHPGRAGFLCIIEEHVEPPDDEMRRASMAMLREHESKLMALASVIEGSGFRASVARSVLVGMQLLYPQFSVPVAFVASVPAAVKWLQSRRCIDDTNLVASQVEKLRNTISLVEGSL
jgi:hypothetical protein